MLAIEEKTRSAGYSFLIGIDEVGRGPLAGPVVAAAVALRKHIFPIPIRDSKQLTPLQREAAFHCIHEQGYVGVGIISELVIDRTDILQATFFAMHNAVRNLIIRLPKWCAGQENFDNKVCLLVDGNRFATDLPYDVRTVINGDAQVLSIACASIVAKVVRDRILNIYHHIFPDYGFDQNKGYPTIQHKIAIRRFGLSPIHRRTFHYR